MTTSVSGGRSDAPAARPLSPSRNARAPSGEDVRAMSDAFATARANMKLDGLPAKGGGKAAATAPTPGGHERPAIESALGAAFDRQVAERRQGERQSDGQGMLLPGQTAPPAIVLAAMPAPQIDPSAFAHMLADLWTRENGKGAKEVRVRFGADAWPATGARLVRNAAGALDIALQIGDAAFNRDGRLPALGGHLAEAGIAVGALTVEHERASPVEA